MLLVGLTTYTFYANAQITLKEADMPKKFQRYALAYVWTDEESNFDATTGGEKAAWDLSSLEYGDDDIDTTRYLGPSETKYQDSFPSANIVFQEDEDGFVMAKSSKDGIEWLGAVFEEDGNTMVLKFDKPFQHVKLPITNTSSHSDESSFIIEQEFGPISFKNETVHKRSYEVTGYGTMKMKDNKDYDVLRLKIIERDSTITTQKSPLGTETSTEVDYEYYYEFWANGFGHPLARVEVDSAHHDSSMLIEVLDMSKTSVGTRRTPEVSVSLYPNPASTTVNVQYSEEGVAVRILDITSKEVVAKNVGMGEIDVTHLQKGMYLVQVLSTEGQAVSVKKLMIE